MQLIAAGATPKGKKSALLHFELHLLACSASAARRPAVRPRLHVGQLAHAEVGVDGEEESLHGPLSGLASMTRVATLSRGALRHRDFKLQKLAVTPLVDVT